MNSVQLFPPTPRTVKDKTVKYEKGSDGQAVLGGVTLYIERTDPKNGQKYDRRQRLSKDKLKLLYPNKKPEEIENELNALGSVTISNELSI